MFSYDVIKLKNIVRTVLTALKTRSLRAVIEKFHFNVSFDILTNSLTFLFNYGYDEIYLRSFSFF